MTKHKVKFDVAAVPPPPEIIQQLGQSWLAGFVVNDLVTRKRLQAVIEKFSKATLSELRRLMKAKGNDDPAVKKMHAKNRRLDRIKSNFNRTIILRGAGGYAFLLIVKIMVQEKEKELLDILSIYDLDNLANPKNRFADPLKFDFPRDGVTEAPKGQALVRLLSDFIEAQEKRLNATPGDSHQ